MAAERHLEHAPIKEAIIDFRVILPEKVTIEDLDRGFTALESDYPNRSELTQGSFGIRIDKGQTVSTSMEQSIEGYRYASADGTQVVQFRSNGFTFSRLEPYLTWEQMKEEAERLWSIFVEYAKPQKIVRVATRYINVMPIPLPFSEFDNVLTAPPQIPDGLPQGVSSFITRIVSRNNDIDATAIVTQAFDTIDNNRAPITLDIDVFADKEFLPEESAFWDYLEQLRIFKNEIFFKSITEETAELFE
ncbi:MAG: TIGR04255 family protein [Candidatus Thiodiazotropha sp.]